MGSHILDVARFLFGEADSLYCQTHRVHRDIRGEDVATVMLRMRAATTVVCEMAYAEPPRARARSRRPSSSSRATSGSAGAGARLPGPRDDGRGHRTPAAAPRRAIRGPTRSSTPCTPSIVALQRRPAAGRARRGAGPRPPARTTSRRFASSSPPTSRRARPIVERCPEEIR